MPFERVYTTWLTSPTVDCRGLQVVATRSRGPCDANVTLAASLSDTTNWMLRQVASSTTVTAVGLLCKAFLRFGCKDVRVEGLEVLTAALEDGARRREGRGIITVSNHISVLDDPLTWGIMPTHTYFSPHLTRWTMGASDIMFTNPVYSTFFRAGQVIETMRGGGIHQEAVTQAIQKLDMGDWVHVFPEGKVNQPSTNPAGGLFPFKWGVGRLIMESNLAPFVIPMWLTGFDAIMPETRASPRLPIPGKRASITFGNDVALNNALRTLLSRHVAHGAVNVDVPDTRKRITSAIKYSIEALRDRVGPLPS